MRPLEFEIFLAHSLNIFRVHSVKMTTASNSGHPTSCSSMAEIMSVLFYRVMRYSVKEPKHPSNDRFVRLWLKYFFL